MNSSHPLDQEAISTILGAVELVPRRERLLLVGLNEEGQEEGLESIASRLGVPLEHLQLVKEQAFIAVVHWASGAEGPPPGVATQERTG